MKAYSFCHYCGTQYGSNAYPFDCKNCGRKVWLNPLPVVIVAIPVYEDGGTWGLMGYLGHVRNNPNDPGYGKTAFASGYVEKHETWETAAIREVKEEFNIDISTVTLERLVSVDGFLCILAKSNSILVPQINWDFTNEETQKLVMITDPWQELAFPVQTEFLKTLHFPGEIYCCTAD